MLRFFDPQQGTIRLGGRDPSVTYPLDDLRKQIFGGYPGYLPFPRLGGRQSAFRKSRRNPGAAGGCCPRRQRPRIHQPAPPWLRLPSWARGPCACPEDRSSESPSPAPFLKDAPHIDSRRGPFQRGCGERGGHTGGPGPPCRGPDHPPHCPPTLQRGKRPPHHGAGQWPAGGSGHAQRACRRWWAVRRADGPAAGAAGIRS